MSFKLSSFLFTILPLIFLLKFSDYYISSFLILKIINCMQHWMSFEVDRYPSAWAHIALCADLTWATEPPDEFIIANQVLLTLFAMTLDPTTLITTLSTAVKCKVVKFKVVQLFCKEKTLTWRSLRRSDDCDVFRLLAAPLGTTLPCFPSPTRRNNRISQLTDK